MKLSSIRIDLLDDTDYCPKRVKLSNWNGKAFYSPRANINNIFKDDYKYFNFSAPGVYILKSDSESNIYSEKIYIGQADDVKKRIKQHLNSDKDFNEIIIFCGDDLHITNVRYIESKLVSLANECKNAEIENGNNPGEPNIDIVEKEIMDDFIMRIKLILPVLGFNFLTQSKIKNDKIKIDEIEKYYLDSKGVKAELIETNEGFVVLKDSESIIEEAESLGKNLSNIRKKYIENKVLIENNGKYKFSENVIFNSLSTAAAIVLGVRVSGPIYWKDKNNKTYQEKNNS